MVSATNVSCLGLYRAVADLLQRPGTQASLPWANKEEIIEVRKAGPASKPRPLSCYIVHALHCFWLQPASNASWTLWPYNNKKQFSRDTAKASY